MLAKVEAEVGADQIRPPLHIVRAEAVEIIARAPEDADFGALVPHAALAAPAKRSPVQRQAVEHMAARRVSVARQRAAADRAGSTRDRAPHLSRAHLAFLSP